MRTSNDVSTISEQSLTDIRGGFTNGALETFRINQQGQLMQMQITNRLNEGMRRSFDARWR